MHRMKNGLTCKKALLQDLVFLNGFLQTYQLVNFLFSVIIGRIKFLQ